MPVLSLLQSIEITTVEPNKYDHKNCNTLKAVQNNILVFVILKAS